MIGANILLLLILVILLKTNQEMLTDHQILFSIVVGVVALIIAVIEKIISRMEL